MLYTNDLYEDGSFADFLRSIKRDPDPRARGVNIRLWLTYRIVTHFLY